ncbi:unnamed protein product [Adineta ricciae]|uniref:Uncharacterized protein n=1 Tax=Adineta ricciae TaxID=249248 RepID=A0A816BGV5_ADIRI|nr:unnamed protein product [Adineta ricciae]
MGSHSSKKGPFSRIPEYNLDHFGVITILFNPIKYRSRYEWYHRFDEHMSRSNVTLLTVECIFDCADELDLPQQKFEITSPNDSRHLQIRAPSVLWLKENLINIAVKRLPAFVEYIAWIDCDIEFERLDWAQITIHQLQRYSVVQLFDIAYFLGPGGKKDVLREDYSFAYAYRHDWQIDARRSPTCLFHPGYGWAMRRSVFENMGGLLEFAVLGSGDLHFAYALINRIDETIPHSVHDDYRSLARIWGQRVAQLVGNGSSVGYLPIHIWHYWHGSRENRGYFERWSILEEHQYSPLRDLEKNDYLGLIRLNADRRKTSANDAKRLSSFEKAIVAYFRSRDEDSLKKTTPSINDPNTKLSVSDTLPPSRTKDVDQASDEYHEYIPLENTRSGHVINQLNATSLTNTPQFYHLQSLNTDHPSGYHNQGFHSDYTHSARQNLASELASITEVSF